MLQRPLPPGEYSTVALVRTGDGRAQTEVRQGAAGAFCLMFVACAIFSSVLGKVPALFRYPSLAGGVGSEARPARVILRTTDAARTCTQVGAGTRAMCQGPSPSYRCC